VAKLEGRRIAVKMRGKKEAKQEIRKVYRKRLAALQKAARLDAVQSKGLYRGDLGGC
jgi:hypothetical protein